MEWISTTDALKKACDALSREPYVAIDTEFMRESTFWPKLCLVQVAAGEVEALIDPLADGISLEPLCDLLRDKSTIKVFHACRQDVEIFFHMSEELIPYPLFDTQIAAMAIGLGDSISYDNLAREYLSVNLDKGSRFTDWSRRPLTDKQKTYALADVTHLRDLYPKLNEQLVQMHREGWVEEEMEILTNPDTYRMEPINAWKRLKIRKRTPIWLAALKAAAYWRETEAQTRDIPRNRIMKDDGLYELAHAAPRTQEDLSHLRAVPKGFERSKPAANLLDIMSKALEDPKAYAPKVERQRTPTTNPGPTVEMLKVLLKVVAENEGVAPRLIATVPDLEKLAIDDDADIQAMKGWRRKVFGEDALKIKRGELAIMLENGQPTVVELE